MISKRVIILAGLLPVLMVTTAFAQWPPPEPAFDFNAGFSGDMDIVDNIGDVRNTTQALMWDLIFSGFNYGLWDGPGISSSAANARVYVDGLTGIGYVSNDMLGFTTDWWYGFYGDAPFAGLTEFGPLSGLSSEILIAYTYYGDTDLDFQVTDADLSGMNIGYDTWPYGGPTGATWLDGDMDFDGWVTDGDLSVAYQSYDASVSGPPTGGYGAGVSQVPEPATWAMILMAVCGLGLLKFFKK